MELNIHTLVHYLFCLSTAFLWGWLTFSYEWVRAWIKILRVELYFFSFTGCVCSLVEPSVEKEFPTARSLFACHRSAAPYALCSLWLRRIIWESLTQKPSNLVRLQFYWLTCRKYESLFSSSSSSLNPRGWMWRAGSVKRQAPHLVVKDSGTEAKREAANVRCPLLPVTVTWINENKQIHFQKRSCLIGLNTIRGKVEMRQMWTSAQSLEGWTSHLN